MWRGPVQLSNGTPALTIFGRGNYLVVSSGINALAYIKFNWQAGDEEVSSTNFDLCFPALGTIQLSTAPPSSPALRNARVVALSSGRISFWGW